jgi:RNA polymerase subunit RPABC4/transcription elongation factor Spt4
MLKASITEEWGANMSNEGGFIGRIRNNWRQRATESTTLKAELRVIPRQLQWVLFAVYVAGLGVVFWISTYKPSLQPFGFYAKPLPLELLAMFAIVTAIATVASLFVMLIVYIGCDAKRRGMSPILWVLLAILVPYLIGVLLYFVLREPLPFSCPQCGRVVSPQFNFCPACQFNLRPSCPQCRLAVRAEDRFCPHCGFPLHSDAPAQAREAEVRQ